MDVSTASVALLHWVLTLFLLLTNAYLSSLAVSSHPLLLIHNSKVATAALALDVSSNASVVTGVLSKLDQADFKSTEGTNI